MFLLLSTSYNIGRGLYAGKGIEKILMRHWRELRVSAIRSLRRD
jgi:hypothetical protein